MTAARARTAAVLLVALFVVVVDQVTKTLAYDHLMTVVGGVRVSVPRHVFGTIYLDLTFNHGFAFGLGQGIEPIVVGVVVIVIVALIVVIGRRGTDGLAWIDIVGLGLLLGGACGNLIDRLFRHNGGAVIDFLDVAQVHDREYWPVFNLADSAIVLGAVILAVQYARASARRAAEHESESGSPRT